MPEPHVLAMAGIGTIIIVYVVYKYNLLGDGKGEVGTRQEDTSIEISLKKMLSRFMEKANG